jgi:hypothetical protein
VGPIAELPYMKKLTIAHRLHHSEKYGGVPWGLFLAPQVRCARGVCVCVCVCVCVWCVCAGVPVAVPGRRPAV